MFNLYYKNFKITVYRLENVYSDAPYNSHHNFEALPLGLYVFEECLLFHF